MQADSPITLVIADDHPIVRKGLKDMIDADGGLRVLAVAADGREAWEAIEMHMPRVAVLDISMPYMSGIEIAQRIRQDALPTAVIILTVYDDEEICEKAINCGVLGYMLKESAVQDIIRCIHRVAEGGHFISPSLTGAVMREHPGGDLPAGELPGLHRLTPMEHRVLRLISSDMSSKEIAEELSVSPRTVERHRSNIAAKLELHGSFSLLRFALAHKQRM